MKRKAFFKNISGEQFSPLEIYLKFLDEDNSYFFESVEGAEKWAKYSIIGRPTKNKISFRILFEVLCAVKYSYNFLYIFYTYFS